MRVLVTGATGKIGNAVARVLAERGEEVLGLVRDPARGHALLPEGVRTVVGDVTDPESLRSAAHGVDAVVNCMGLFEQYARDREVFELVNAEGSRNVVAAAREAGARRVVHTSTFDVFDAPPGGTVSEEKLAAEPKGTLYERSKQRAEELVLAEAAKGIEVVIVNPATVFGPGPWAEAGLDGALRDVVRRRIPATPPGGFTLAYVEDVAAGHVAALERGVPGERYILADGFATMHDIFVAAVEAAGRGWVPPTIPVRPARVFAAAGEAVARLTGLGPLLARGQLDFLLWQARADASKAERELGVTFLPWREGIARTVRWMAEIGRI